MNFTHIFKSMKAGTLDGHSLIGEIETELGEAISIYWSTADRVLRGSSITLGPPEVDYVSLEKNFFSALFLYSYQRAGISRRRRILYGVINQALRGIVTGCDNILDDEYKTTLATDLPIDAVRFRSVMDMLVSDRVIFDMLMASANRGDITYEQATEANRVTLTALGRSGAQEASEEEGVVDTATPDDILTNVHHYKTGILFQAPWAVPEAVEGDLPASVAHVKIALYNVGMGCQIMDDMVDMPVDMKKRRHNYALSLAMHGSDRDERAKVEAMMQRADLLDASSAPLLDLPITRMAAASKASEFLRYGLGSLFENEHSALVGPSIYFLVNRLRAGRLMAGVE